MTAGSKLRGQKKGAASSFCPFAPVESFLVAYKCNEDIMGSLLILHIFKSFAYSSIFRCLGDIS